MSIVRPNMPFLGDFAWGPGSSRTQPGGSLYASEASGSSRSNSDSVNQEVNSRYDYNYGNSSSNHGTDAAAAAPRPILPPLHSVILNSYSAVPLVASSRAASSTSSSSISLSPMATGSSPVLPLVHPMPTVSVEMEAKRSLDRFLFNGPGNETYVSGCRPAPLLTTCSFTSVSHSHPHSRKHGISRSHVHPINADQQAAMGSNSPGHGHGPVLGTVSVPVPVPSNSQNTNHHDTVSQEHSTDRTENTECLKNSTTTTTTTNIGNNDKFKKSPSVSSSKKSKLSQGKSISSNRSLPLAERRKYICKICSRGFTTSGHLARHNRIHTGEKRHKCQFPGCTQRFSRHDNYIQHYRTHFKNHPNAVKPPPIDT